MTRTRKTAYLCLLFSCFLAVNPVLGEATRIEDVLDRMQSVENQIKDLEFSFTQDIEFKTVKESYRLEGGLLFKQPNRVVFDQSAPVKQKLVSDGKRLWVYSPEKKQVYIDKWKKWKGITYFLPGVFYEEGRMSKLRKNLVIKLDSEDEKNYVLYIVPKKDKKINSYFPGGFEFYMWVDKADMYPKKTKFISRDFQCVTDTKEWKINTGLKDDLFKFSVPEGVEVFHLR
jgi:chaperone LolA